MQRWSDAGMEEALRQNSGISTLIPALTQTAEKKRTPGFPTQDAPKTVRWTLGWGSLTADLVSVPQDPARPWNQANTNHLSSRLVPQWPKSRRGLAGLLSPFPSLRGQPAS